MGGLAHTIESEGVPTTQVSLIRLHTETMRAPRALWVPFELGRPLGAPDDAAFQRRVLLDTLRLLEAASGPVLVDFPDEAPAGGMVEGWACPIQLAGTADADTPAGRLAAEIRRLHPWYDEAVARRGRTTVGAGGLAMADAGAFMAAFLDGGVPESPLEGVAPAALLKTVLEDLKAFYLEAIAAQPGGAAGAGQLADWFWGETEAGRIMLDLHPVLSGHADERLKQLGLRLLVPRSQEHRL